MSVCANERDKPGRCAQMNLSSRVPAASAFTTSRSAIHSMRARNQRKKFAGTNTQTKYTSAATTARTPKKTATIFHEAFAGPAVSPDAPPAGARVESSRNDHKNINTTAVETAESATLKIGNVPT